MELEVHPRDAIPLLIVLKVTIVVLLTMKVRNIVMDSPTVNAHPILGKISDVHVMNLIVFL